MKKVLLAITSLRGGGAERVVSVWASQLAEKGYEVAVFTYAKSEGEYFLSPKVKRLTLADDIKDYLSIGYLERYSKMRRIVKNYAPDVVISFLHNMQIWMAAATVGMRIKRVDTVRISPWHSMSGRITNALLKACFATGDMTILQSEDQKDFFSKRVQKKCVVVPNPLGEIYEMVGKSEFPARIKRFMAAGRVCPQKNFPLLIKAFAKACEKDLDITLDIFGKGNEKYVSELQELIDSLGMSERIKLCGRTDNVHGELMAHDAFVMSSDYEGMPNALAEAMAVGLVCISTDCRTGPRDLIENGKNGFLVPTGDVSKMTEKIAEATAMDAEQIINIGTAARTFVTDFCGRENSLKKLTKAIEK